MARPAPHAAPPARQRRPDQPQPAPAGPAAREGRSNGKSAADRFRLAAEYLDRAIPHLRNLPEARQAHLHALRARQALVEMEIADTERDDQ